MGLRGVGGSWRTVPADSRGRVRPPGIVSSPRPTRASRRPTARSILEDDRAAGEPGRGPDQHAALPPGQLAPFDRVVEGEGYRGGHAVAVPGEDRLQATRRDPQPAAD